MWQELRDYWLPLMLFAGALLVAVLLLALVYRHTVPDRATTFHARAAGSVRRGHDRASLIDRRRHRLMVTAFVFFRPNASVFSRKSSSKKPPGDTMAGA